MRTIVIVLLLLALALATGGSFVVRAQDGAGPQLEIARDPSRPQARSGG